MQHGRLLAARRTTPPEAAGRWELPGGKVETGESADDALRREIREELGCDLVVERWLAGEQPIGTAYVLRVAVCRLAGSARPTAGDDHDELRWLTPESLGEVEWLEPDRPFLTELEQTLLDGEVLPGGNVGGAVRVGATVRRPTGPWTPAVHALLDHVRATGLRAVPRVHGFDVRGREVLDFLPGETVDERADLVSEVRLADLGRWTRELHDAVDFEHPGPWRFPPSSTYERVLHNDLGLHNLVFEGDGLAGVFDWDVAGPGDVVSELAYIAWCAVPLFRPVPDDVAARRLRVLAAAYDGPSAAEILAAVPDRITGVATGLRAGIEAGDPTLDLLAARGEPANLERDLAAFVDRMPGVTAALGPS